MTEQTDPRALSEEQLVQAKDQTYDNLMALYDHVECQADEIRSLREQLAARDARVAELEARLTELELRFPPLQDDIDMAKQDVEHCAFWLDQSCDSASKRYQWRRRLEDAQRRLGDLLARQSIFHPKEPTP